MPFSARVACALALAMAMTMTAGAAAQDAAEREPAGVAGLSTATLSLRDRAGFGAWQETVRRQPWDHYQCRPVTELPGTVLCLFSHSLMMNRIFARLAAAVETPRTYSRGTGNNLGIDLRVVDIERNVPRDPTATERRFLSGQLAWLKEELGAAAIIAAPWGNAATIEHELLHGYYFSVAAYRDAVTAFWHEVLTPAQRHAVRGDLGSHYDPGNEDLMINEFQAYVLQHAYSGWLQGQRGSVRGELLAFLRQRGLTPVLPFTTLDDTAAP